MSLLPDFVNARLRKDDSAPPAEAADDSHDASAEDHVFDLVPPDASESVAVEPEPIGRNRHPVDMTDLSRLSIDRDGKLYWDGKPVEVRRRITMSRAQIVGASIVAVFIMIGALGAAVQGAATAYDWACRIGWSTGACAGAPTYRPDIPA